MSTLLQRFANWSFHPGKKRVFAFADGSQDDYSLLGAKGSHLCEMTRLKLPIPQGFIITTETSLDYFNSAENVSHGAGFAFAENLPEQLVSAYKAFVYDLEIQTGKKFGKAPEKPEAASAETTKQTSSNGSNLPLLLALRCDTPYRAQHASQTILNLGMNDETVSAMAQNTNELFALDCYRRFIQMFATTVYGIPRAKFEDISATILARAGKKAEQDLDTRSFRALVDAYKEVALIPDDPWRQLEMAIVAYYRWWFSERSMAERALHEVQMEKGLAVIVQSMVYGNLTSKSGTGVCSTRCPTTGEKMLAGEFLPSSEGEELFIGRRSPVSLETMKAQRPEIYDKLASYASSLENHFKDMQDIYFTVENKNLYILQSEPGRRSSKVISYD
jgi:pyruvate,orthophosphate dikinase